LADLALSNSLIDEYVKYRLNNNYDQSIIRKLFKYIQPFSIKSDNICMSDPSMPALLENDPLIEIIEPCSDEELVQNTILKFMITDNDSPESYKILYLDSPTEKLKPKYGATYINKFGKDKAQEHIKFLLSDASYINITDAYIATTRNWSDNKALIASIVPNINIILTIIGADKGNESVISESKIDELKSLLPSLSEVRANRLASNVHDRYIKTDKIKILMSSGLDNLLLSSETDFTYIIEIL